MSGSWSILPAAQSSLSLGPEGVRGTHPCCPNSMGRCYSPLENADTFKCPISAHRSQCTAEGKLLDFGRQSFVCSVLFLLANGGGPRCLQWPPLTGVSLHGSASVQSHRRSGAHHSCTPGSLTLLYRKETWRSDGIAWAW